MTSAFKLTGKHVLAIIVGFFLMVIAANTIFITLAVKSFPGEQEKKSYLQGLAYNDRIKERERQAALGWSAELTKAGLTNDGAVVEITFENSSTNPIYGLTVTGLLARPADGKDDHELVFASIGEGRYSAKIEGVAPGLWRLHAVAVSERGEKFELEKRLMLE